jgi:hypothetical protein
MRFDRRSLLVSGEIAAATFACGPLSPAEPVETREMQTGAYTPDSLS